MLGPKSALHRWCLRSFHEFFVANINRTIDICIINVGKLPKTFTHSLQGNWINFCAECSCCCLNLGEQLVVVLDRIFGTIFSHKKLNDKMEELENYRKIVFENDKNWFWPEFFREPFQCPLPPYESMILLDWFNDGYATTYPFRGEIKKRGVTYFSHALGSNNVFLSVNLSYLKNIKFFKKANL